MDVSDPTETIQRARTLRRQMTKPERLLWWALRRKQTGFHFRRQHPAGPYVLDFYCDAARLCVEVDGEHHSFQVSQDRRRDGYLAKLGVTTIRIPAHEVLTNLQGVVDAIERETRHLIRQR